MEAIYTMEFASIIPSQNDERILYLSADVGSESVSDICKQILQINETDRKGVEKFKKYAIMPIELHVQSFGGSVYDMWALIDIIESSNTPIITYCNGYCMSAAALIFLSGHIRCMYKHSTIMLHQMWTMDMGKVKDIQLAQKQTDDLHKQMIKFIKKHTNLKKKFFDRYDKGKEDVYFDAKQSLKHGICDQIVENTDWRNMLLDQLNAETQMAVECSEDLIDD